MALGAREVLVAVRARDVTSRVLREIGTNFGDLAKKTQTASERMFNTGAALTAVGVGMAGVGATGLSFFNKSVDSFIEYSRQAAYTKTQVDQLGVSVADIGDIGLRVADKIPVPFDEIQTALYDIFSSLDVNVTEAEHLLELFSQGAVAGQTDVQTAARSTIAVMNAYQLPFSQANSVMDIMFEMVRKGVGSYEEFNQAIGRAIPAAVSASQEFDTLAGVMAFLTRGGLSTQMAATSAARAMELFTKPDVVKSLRDIGVEVVNAQGDFKQMDVILRDLAGSKGWADLGDAKRKELFADIFGVGTIQARRFFDTAIPNFQELINLTDITADSGGALGQAYMTMFNEPAMQAQLLANKYKLLQVEIGENLLPAKIRLMEVAMSLIDWWNNLSDSTKSLTVKIAAGAAAFLVIGGAALTLVGAFMMIAGVVGGVGAAFAIFTGVPLIIGAIIAITVLLIKNWDKVKEVAETVKETVIDAFHSMVERVKDLWAWFQNLSLAGKILVGVVLAIVAPFTLVVAAVVAIVKNFGTLIDVAKGVWEWFNNLHMAGKILLGVIAAIVAPWLLLVAAGVAIVKNWSTVVEWAGKLTDAIKAAWEWFNNLNTVFKVIGAVIAGVLLSAMSPVLAFIASVVLLGMTIAKHWETIKSVTIAVWSAIVDAVDAAWQMFKDFWDWLTNIDIDVWGSIQDAAVSAWDAIKSATSAAVNAIMAVLTPLWDALQTGFDWFMEHFGHQFVEIWNTIYSEVSDIIEELGETTGSLWKYIQFAWDRILPILEAFGKQFVATFQFAMGVIQSVFIPIWRVVIAIVVGAFEILKDALGIMITSFKLSWNLITTIIRTAIDIIAAVIEGVVGLVMAAWNNFGDLLLVPIQIFWDFISRVFRNIITIASNFVQMIVNLFQGDWGEAWGNFKDIVSATLDNVLAVVRFFVDMFLKFFSELPGRILSFLGDALNLLFQVGKDIILGLLRGLGEATVALTTFFVEMGPKILDLLADAGTWLFEVGKAILTGLVDGLKSLWGSITDFVSDLYHGIVDGIKAFFGISSPSTIMYGIGKDMIQGLLNGAKLIWELVKTFFSGVYGTILGYFSDAISWLTQKGKDILQGLWGGITTVFGFLMAWVRGETGIQSTIKGYFSNAKDWLVEGGKNILTGMWNGVRSIWASIKEWFGSVPGKILEALGIASPPQWSIDAGKDIAKGIFEGLGLGIGDAFDFLLSLGPKVLAIIAENINPMDAIAGALNIGQGNMSEFFGSYQELGRLMAKQFGWTGHQWEALSKLWHAESGWNPLAKNPSSGAFGIPQALPASKMGPAALSGDPYSMAAAQIAWGLQYIQQRYGNPAHAWAFWNAQSPHWYEKGAWKIAQNELAYLHKGEMVVPEKFADAIRRGQASGMATGGRGANFNFYGDVSFGSDMQRATADLDFWSRTATAGV